ncbi:hypothetical protein BD779DRAFT_1441881 [Infundibulicybe gibba]|nr:hypothetical protein BD779DRAFT_1441881 [Infundibulicybe gibba]
MAVANIILFGETGSGKSSIVNMLAGKSCAVVSSAAKGCTFEHKKYQVDIMGKPFHVFDTAGLDEGNAGTVPKQQAIVQLYGLLKSLKEGVNLLIYCMRGPRLKESAPKNWRLFNEVMCQKKVPGIIAITGLEQEEVMEDWWYRNKGEFQKYDMHCAGHACITATRGKQMRSGAYILEAEYVESRETLVKAISATYLSIPWRAKPIEWFREIVTITYESRICRDPKEHRDVQTVVGPGIEELVSRCEMSAQEAEDLGKMLSKV